MGSGTKKQKKDKEISRKRRHHSRSRSRSPELSEKYKREHKRHHREKKRDGKYDKKNVDYESADSDCIEMPPAPQISRSPPSPPSPPRSRSHTDNSENECNGTNKGESLSIEETNKLRAKLGLKPLEVSSTASSNDGKIKDDLGEFYHAPAKNLSRSKTEQKLRDRLDEKKEKRQLEKRLAAVRTLGESDGEEDAVSWVNKNREIERQKQEASKRAKLLEEMDAVFGVGELVAEDLEYDKRKVYNARHLKGMRVEHDAEMFKEGKDIILTLKDQDVLDDEGDALVNVNFLDEERYNQSNENKKQKANQYGYNVYDDTGDPENRTLLAKYDEVIDSEKNVAKNAFTIGEKISSRNSAMDSIKAKLSNKRLESLNLPELKLASEYFTPEEIAFKKPKKKVRKIRQKPKMLKADDLLAMDGSNNSWLKNLGHRRPKPEQDIIETDDIGHVPMDTKDIKLEPEVDNDLELALSKARKLKQRETPRIAPLDVKIEIKEEAPVDGAIVLNATAEFCRSLGEIPTYGLSGNRDEEPNELMDYEAHLSPTHETSAKEGSWSKVTDTPEVSVPAAVATAPILEDEPNIGWGVSGALKLAMSKGYLEKEDQNRPSSSRFAHLQAKNYSIEDKSFGDDDKFGGRRERYAGPTTDFKEKEGFKPNVKLDYIDDDGHVLSAKEAFRYLSHKFHGKGPGKNKVEKRIKKNEQEGLMKKMSSTDTPLGTLGMLQAKQKETHSAFVVLSGNKTMQGTTVISKNKR
uniref:Putative snrnp associated protein n=1 Tax=Xenopsylla cheopis TaxID=163159 RepID=A0A6M2DL00_XENCH